MKRRLSTVEHLVDVNVTFILSIKGSLSVEQLRLALDKIQRKHPALRMLIEEKRGELYYYEPEVTKKISLRVVERVADGDLLRERHIELATPFAQDEPQLRIVWLRTAQDGELFISAAHRICDGMSMLTLIRELLKSLYSDEELLSYEPITIQDIIGDLGDEGLLKRKKAARLANAVIALIPGSRRPLQNKEIFQEWAASPALSAALRRRCKLEKAPINAALLTALDLAFQQALGKSSPAWLDVPFDGRRGRLSMLKRDMLFFGGGSFKIKTGQSHGVDFWARARDIHRESNEKIAVELANTPGKYQFLEMLKIPSVSKMRTIARLQNLLSRYGRRGVFSFSNLGNLILADDQAPFQVADFHGYVHSFSVRFMSIGTYSLHGQLRFIYSGDEKCLNLKQVAAVRHHFMALLEQHVGEEAVQVAEPAGVLSAVTE
ncbi:condensation domain-containing protein [Dyella silvatica]|uniref:condensation domain-containing protein n=1 Tax=Dyella silvatica TaxID=2992128 RepID=UPI0022540027|nr:condensation domain-containing protein [Dyella silvatica]